MEETKKGGTSPGNAGSATAVAPPPASTPAGPRSEAAGPVKRRLRLAGDAEKGPAARMRVRRDANELKVEAIRALSNLPEAGRFFLLWSRGQTGKRKPSTAGLDAFRHSSVTARKRGYEPFS
jgi:hypothetical protein